ncbi:MAG: hypothetical protein HYZ21_04415 [Chloroflexi bacterium]|nr:hypothetical protein [Chloroflexota bacterium]
MKKIFAYHLIFLFAVIFVLSAFAPMRIAPKEQHARLARHTAQISADVYNVQVIVLNLFDIDLNAGTYSMDFYLMFSCADSPCEREPKWDVLNSTSGLDVQDQGTSIPFTYYEYRVKADMIGRVDYTYYPFDYLYVDVYIEDKEYSSDEISYEYSSIIVDPYLFNPAGWFHNKNYDGGTTYVIEYGDPDITFDRLNLWLFLERDWFGAFMKTVFAAIVIVMIGMLSYLMKTNATTERLALVSSTLVAIVLYHISLVAGVPATGYLTFIDKFMIWTYLIVFLSLVVSVMMMVLVNEKKQEKAERLHAQTRWLVPLLWIAIMAYVFIFELIIPYKQLLTSISA